MPKKKQIKLRGIIGLDDNATPEFLERGLAEAGGGLVQIDINSPGGFMYDGLEMANMIRRYPGHVTARVVGFAASAASYIPMMADTVEVEDNTVFMIHNPAFAVFGLDYHAAEKVTAVLKGLARLLGKAYADKTGKSPEVIAQLMDEETYFFGEEIKTEGFADRVVKGEIEGDKTKALAFAQGEIQACEELLRETGKPVQHEKIAALLGSNTPMEKKMATPSAPAPTADKTPEAKTLADILAANPEAKAEHDALIVKAGAGDSLEGKILSALDAGLQVLVSAEYPAGIKERVAAQMKLGDAEGVRNFIALYDTQAEAAKEKEAEGTEAPPETPPEGPKASADDYAAKKQRFKGA